MANSGASADEYMTLDEVAVWLRQAEGTLRYWRHVGKGPRSFKLGGKRVLYARADVEAWISQERDGSGISA